MVESGDLLCEIDHALAQRFGLQHLRGTTKPQNAGARRLDVRGWAICYHLWHPPASRANLTANDQLLQTALRQKAAWCESGLSTHR